LLVPKLDQRQTNSSNTFTKRYQLVKIYWIWITIAVPSYTSVPRINNIIKNLLGTNYDRCSVKANQGPNNSSNYIGDKLPKFIGDQLRSLGLGQNLLGTSYDRCSIRQTKDIPTRQIKLEMDYDRNVHWSFV
jgi:hypothetical protein